MVTPRVTKRKKRIKKVKRVAPPVPKGEKYPFILCRACTGRNYDPKCKKCKGSGFLK